MWFAGLRRCCYSSCYLLCEGRRAVAHGSTEPQGDNEAEPLDQLGRRPDRVERLRARLQQRNPGDTASRIETNQARQQKRGAPGGAQAAGTDRKRGGARNQQPGGNDERDTEQRRLAQMLGDQAGVGTRTEGTAPTTLLAATALVSGIETCRLATVGRTPA